MTSTALVIDDVVHRLDGTRVWLRAGHEQGELALDAVGQAAVDAAIAIVDAQLASGVSLEDAMRAAAATVTDIPGRTSRRQLANGAVLLDDTAAATALEVRASLRALADIVRGGARSIVVLGELETEPADWFDDHDALGRIVVRLDVSQLIVVGDGARHIHNAAGLEGSWDGESMLVGTLEQAYDVVRAQVDEGDVVLVSAASRTPLHALVDRLLEADR